MSRQTTQVGAPVGYLVLIEKWAENLEEVMLSRWLKREGDTLEQGDSLCEIITDKVTFEYEVEVPGVLRRIYCPPKSTIPVGYAIAFVGEEEEMPPPGVERQNRDLLQARTAAAKLDLSLDSTTQGASPVRRREPAEHRVRATPAARRVARENGVTIEEVAAWMDGEGPVGQADVEAYLLDHEDE